MISCRSARLLKMQNGVGGQGSTLFTSQKLWAAGHNSECRHWFRAQSDNLSEEATM